ARTSGEESEWNWAAAALSVHLIRTSDWKKARLLLEEIPTTSRKGATWQQLAIIDLSEGNCAAAKEKSGKALQMFQEIGDRVGEAATWHGLASIDLREGNYVAAKDKFAKCLEMDHEI